MKSVSRIFIGLSIFCIFMCIKTFREPSGDALIWLLASPFMFLIGATLSVTDEDNRERQTNPESIRAIDLLIPFLIIRHWQIILFAAICLVYWIVK